MRRTDVHSVGAGPWRAGRGVWTLASDPGPGGMATTTLPAPKKKSVWQQTGGDTRRAPLSKWPGERGGLAADPRDELAWGVSSPDCPLPPATCEQQARTSAAGSCVPAPQGQCVSGRRAALRRSGNIRIHNTSPARGLLRFGAYSLGWGTSLRSRQPQLQYPLPVLGTEGGW